MLEKVIVSSILIIAVLLIRAVFQNKVNPLYLYPVWLLVAVRLLLPGMIAESPFSVMNTRLWKAVSAVITEEYERQDKEYKEQKYQEYYSRVIEEQKNAAEPNNNEDIEKVILDPVTGEEMIYHKPEAYEIKWHLNATLFGKLELISVILWVAGMGVFTLIFVWQNLSFYSYLRATRKRDSVVTVGIREIPVFTAGDKLCSPCLFGLFPAVYMPEGNQGNTDSLAFILEHELTHYRHGDHIWSFVRILCLITNWYNPLVWIAAKLSMRDGELACDAGCVRRLGEEKRCAYGEALLAMIKPVKGREDLFKNATMMTSGKKFMEKRIKGIAGGRKNGVFFVVIMLIVVALCVGFTYTGAVQEDDMIAARDDIHPMAVTF